MNGMWAGKGEGAMLDELSLETEDQTSERGGQTDVCIESIFKELKERREHQTNPYPRGGSILALFRGRIG